MALIENIKKTISYSFSKNNSEENYYYILINANYFNEFKSIIHWEEIYSILSNHKELFFH